MRCPACGAESPDGSPENGSCPRCGASAAPSHCPQCGFTNPPIANFCGGCGRPIGLLPFDPARVGSVGAHTPQHLAERILRMRDAIVGERKHVTVMFADVRGSFELIEGADPERVQGVLDATIRIMTDAVHRYEGTVAQILGDGIMALFGAPLAHEDHAVRAAYAALAMLEAMRRRDAPGDADLGLHPQIRVGLNSGEVVIGAIGNDLSVDYRAVGATTHMAARMEQTALPGTIRLTGETLRLAEGLIQVQPLGPTVVKGVSQPVEIYELVGRTSRTRFQAQIERGLSPFVGREAELDELRGALRDVAGGASRAVIVEGEPGIGKSRLCHELLSESRAASDRVLEASAVSYGRTPFGVMGALLRAQLELAPDAPLDVIEAALASELERTPALAPFRASLASGLDLPVADADWLGLDPATRRQRSFEALRGLLAALSQARPLILLVEDLHWLDEESVAFLETLVEQPPEGRLLVLLTHRPELAHDWPASSRHLRLEPLSRESSGALVARLLGERSELESLRRQLAERTHGNPFFIEESVRALVEGGVLVGRAGAYALASPNPTIEIPPSVESLIAARLDRLPPQHKELLRAAAVIGDEMPPELLQSVLGISDDDFRARLAVTEQLGILVQATLFPAHVCRFRHSLIREVLYRQMLSPQRRDLHARVLTVLERLHGDRVGEHLDLLAGHAFEGRIWDRSVDYHRRACVRAATRWANRDAVALLDRGLESLGHLPASDERTRAAIDLRLSGLAPLLPLGDQERMLRLLREAERMAESLGDARRLGAVYSQLATALWMAAEHDLALEAGEKALALAQEQQSFALRKAALHNLGMVHHARGDFARAIEIQRELVREFAGELERKRFGWAGYPSVLCRTFLGSSLTFVGEFGAALEHFDAGVRIADDIDHPYSRAIVREELGYCLLSMAQPAAALAVLETAMDICRENQVYTMYPAISGRLAVALAECGRAGQAIELAEDALARETHRLGGRYALDYLLLGLSSAYLRAGRVKDALVPASRAEALTGAAGEHAHHALALFLLGEIHAASGGSGAADAERALEGALALSERHRMRPLAARCRHALGELYVREGQRDEAARALEGAVRGYRELDLAEPLAEASTRLARLSVG